MGLVSLRTHLLRHPSRHIRKARRPHRRIRIGCLCQARRRHWVNLAA